MPGRLGLRPAGRRTPHSNRRLSGVFAAETRAADASWTTQAAGKERERYLLVLKRYRHMGNQTRRVWLGSARGSLYVWHSLPLFVGVIPVLRLASHGPVHRGGGAENGFSILARGLARGT